MLIKPATIARPRNQKYPYGKTDLERKEFTVSFSKLAGKISVDDIAEKLNITPKQVRSFAGRSGWSIKVC